jgi:hypothetical protein
MSKASTKLEQHGIARLCRTFIFAGVVHQALEVTLDPAV